MPDSTTALMIVDMQKYYLNPDSDYCRYFSGLYPGCLDYIMERCGTIVVPNIRRLLQSFRERRLPVQYLRLCSSKTDRSDLHRLFRDTHFSGKNLGYENVYPLGSDPMASVLEDISPHPADLVIDKTTFSPFTRTGIEELLRERGIERIIFTGLATSQCVETTARDASDRGFSVIHIEDALADYDEMSHTASLFGSRGVCGGGVFGTDEFLQNMG